MSVAQTLVENIFLQYGVGEILTDNGEEFHYELLNEVCRLMGIVISFTMAYEARTIGICERSHATSNLMLAKCINENQKDWTEHLSYVAFYYNVSAHKSTKFSPFFLLHEKPPLPLHCQRLCRHIIDKIGGIALIGTKIIGCNGKRNERLLQ